ncbi:hypothetical protein DICTH_0112 [Dictyoglomus thermophilum H-6-12]|uniref:Uncharacterized protein n=1 Tax=Dictyoglomus thermophilum (strain ATCC 35947 / DSM 3960 / H-6-12) TaxID=309799 RepID=B5YBD1_DICT6|nr:hypothetical protein DICTH_0112 [Dictyoglomus thermophilum H-6-12]
MIINDIIRKKSKGGVLIEKDFYSFSYFPFNFAYDCFGAENSNY